MIQLPEGKSKALAGGRGLPQQHGVFLRDLLSRFHFQLNGRLIYAMRSLGPCLMLDSHGDCNGKESLF